MDHRQSHLGSSPFRSRDWVLHEASEQELLDYLHHLLAVQQEQQEELTALVEVMVEDRLAMQDEMEQAIMEAWHVDSAAAGTPWLSLGVAGLIGYLVGRQN